MNSEFFGKVRRGLRKPPGVIAARLAAEVRARADRYGAPRQARGLTAARLVAALGDGSAERLWERLQTRPYFAHTSPVDAGIIERLCPGSAARIVERAADALAHRVDLLGSGPIELGADIDWHRDYKTGKRWEPAYFHDIEYNNLHLPSDVKMPWEISRLQWLIPAGQAYLLSGDERYAAMARDVLADWMRQNHYAWSVNWSCTMEVALRIVTFTWLFHIFAASSSWSDAAFREQFLRCVFLHGKFTARHLEKSDVNGNHYTADAAGLVCAGLFFGAGAAPVRWATLGWDILLTEMPRQISPDGVDFEGSIPYHRLVLELFLLPALYRRAAGLEVPREYLERLAAMCRFTETYLQPDGMAPVFGDADDARALPFGAQCVNDHRYLLAFGAIALNDESLADSFSGPLDEVFWMFGPAECERLADRKRGGPAAASRAFRDGGFYIMRNGRDHVCIDCGPIGTAGRGGHGHNDCLSFEAVIDGVRLICDCGAYVYTASAQERNLFRSTAYHNTPRVDEEEMNRFIRWDYLWTLRNDAIPQVRKWSPGPRADIFVGAHTGFQKLAEPVTPVRTIELDHRRHSLTIEDAFEGTGQHQLRVPLHLAPGVTVTQRAPQVFELRAGDRRYEVVWSDAGQWQARVEPARVSPSYGRILNTQSIVWSRTGPIDVRLRVEVRPAAVAAVDAREEPVAAGVSSASELDPAAARTAAVTAQGRR